MGLSSDLYCINPSSILHKKMAPVDIDHVPRSIIAPVKNMKVVDKALSLPLVSSACSEMTRVTSPIMESTYNKVSPVVENTLEMVTPVMDSVKSKVEEQVLPHIPSKITESVQNYQEAAVDKVIAAVEKVDTIACGGIDQLTEKVPQLKEATPKLMEETKSSVSTFVTRWSQYFASFSVALVALKVVDVSLERVEEALKKIDSENAKTMSSLVQMVHSIANSLRHDAARSAGTPLAKKIDESSLTGALGEMTGLNGLMEKLVSVMLPASPSTEEKVQPEAVTEVKEAAPLETSEPTVTEAVTESLLKSCGISLQSVKETTVTEETKESILVETPEVAIAEETKEATPVETPETATTDVKEITPEETLDVAITEETKEVTPVEESEETSVEFSDVLTREIRDPVETYEAALLLRQMREASRVETSEEYKDEGVEDVAVTEMTDEVPVGVTTATYIKDATPEAFITDVNEAAPVEEMHEAVINEANTFITEDIEEAVIVEEAIDVATEVAKYEEASKVEETKTSKRSKKPRRDQRS